MAAIFLRAMAFAGAVLLAPLAAAQTISTPLQVRTGDVFTVNVDYTQSAELGEQQFDATMSYVYSIHVLDAEQRLWRFMPVSMSYQLPETPGLEAQMASVNWPAMSDMMSAMMRITTDVGFECRVDEYGRCTEMTNWPFWSARVENLAIAFDAAARMFPNQPGAGAADVELAPPAAVEERPGKSDEAAAPTTLPASTAATPNWETLRGPVMRGVARLIDGFDSRDAASSMAGMYLPAFVQGRTLTRRQTVDVVDEYDMPFGAPPLRYTGTLRLDRIDQRNNAAIVTRRSQLDQESARAAINGMTEFVSAALIEPLAPYFPEGQQPPDATGIAQLINTMLADFGYEETTRGVIDLTTGMARETTTDFTLSARFAASEEPIVTRGRIVTRVTATAPEAPRLPRS
ncbi:MAG TPA: hypothetical protein VEA80_13495 [Vitreimonas sp.]|uniref:hypothetical protein n=1 Tax=Vitreimonas sp. TaxID=3069702 RepID=UPI002D6218E6|nr:hypothetical protein [Vitreimonas sp.]HYD88484.1 hypothetical protein [Vitreimonas sp.]